MASGTATVKAVISGDTLVLVGAATNGPPPELMLTLSSLQAPRLARSAEAFNEVHAARCSCSCFDTHTNSQTLAFVHIL